MACTIMTKGILTILHHSFFRVEVTSDDEEEMVSELMQFYSANLKNMPRVAREELRERAVKLIREVRDKVVTQ